MINYPTWFLVYKSNGQKYGQTFGDGEDAKIEANECKQAGELVIYVNNQTQMETLATKHGFKIPNS